MNARIEKQADEFYEKFNRHAADLHPEVSYEKVYCRELAEMSIEVKRLSYERGELILGHYYQRPEVQEVCHFVEDSLGLALKAKEILEGKIANPIGRPVRSIRLCAVKFMGDTMKIIIGKDRRNEVKVYMPQFAGCSLVAYLHGIEFDHRTMSEKDVSLRLISEKPTRHRVDEWLEKNPGGLVLSYMNSDPESKAKSYGVFTSRNGYKVLEYAMRENPGKRVLMLPDQFLSQIILRRAIAQKNPWIKTKLVDMLGGECHVHRQKISLFALEEAMAEHPRADLYIHPECGCAVDCMIKAEQGGFGDRRSFICSTHEMIQHALEKGSSEEIIVATEAGHVYAIRKAVPDKKVFPVSFAATCEFMKATTIENLLSSMRDPDQEKHEVRLPYDIIERAWQPIERMLSIM